MWAMLCHLSALLTIFAGAGFVVSLIIWMVKRDSSPLVADQGKESLNFQITLLIAAAVALACFFTVILIPISIALLIVLPVWQLVLTIIAAIKAYDGQYYRYPLTLRLI
jgi:uncharacterized Tic20 family protein